MGDNMHCWKCGKSNATETRGFGFREFGSITPFENQRHYCKECLAKEREEIKKKKAQYVRLKKALMLERAITLIEKSGADIYEYEDEIRAVGEYINEKPDKFDTAHEIVVAVMLLWNRVDAKVQQPIGSYRVDFLLPSEKMVLEVDGEVHKASLYTDNQRDIALREELGNEWEVVRIGNEYVESNPELVLEAAREVKRYKQEIRKKNFGLLPEWYSKRERQQKPKKKRDIVIGDDRLFDI